MSVATQLKRDCLTLWRQPGDVLLPFAFFVLVMILFPMAITTDPTLLERIGPGLIWVAAVLAMLMAINLLFSKDFQEGILEQWCLNGMPLYSRILTRIGSYWLASVIPIVALLPILGLMYHLSLLEMYSLLFSLLLGTPILWLLGAVIASITLGLSQAYILFALLLLPLSIPVVIFGVGWVTTANAHLSVSGPALMLTGVFILALVCAPFVCQAALRLAINES